MICGVVEVGLQGEAAGRGFCETARIPWSWYSSGGGSVVLCTSVYEVQLICCHRLVANLYENVSDRRRVGYVLRCL